MKLNYSWSANRTEHSSHLITKARRSFLPFEHNGTGHTKLGGRAQPLLHAETLLQGRARRKTQVRKTFLQSAATSLWKHTLETFRSQHCREKEKQLKRLFSVNQTRVNITCREENSWIILQMQHWLLNAANFVHVRILLAVHYICLAQRKLWQTLWNQIVVRPTIHRKSSFSLTRGISEELTSIRPAPPIDMTRGTIEELTFPRTALQIDPTGGIGTK